jgi:hypothetical protein
MSPTALSELAIFALIAAFVIYRQLVPRPVRGASTMFILPLILAGYGAYSLLVSPPAGAASYLILAGELAISAVAGVTRGFTIRFWVDPSGVPMQRGTWLTLVVWALFIAVRVGAFALVGHALGTPELLLSFGTSLLIQSAVTYLRGQALQQVVGQPEGLYQ